MIRERNYLWDNMKALLIFLVVVGHAMEVSTFHNSLARGTVYWIYSFHMPAFIFVSGFLSKHYCTDGKVRAEKAGTLIAYYAIFEALFLAVRMLFIMNGFKGSMATMSPLQPSRGLWYILILIFCYLLIPVIEKIPPYIVVPISIFLAVIVGRDKWAGSYLSVLRFFVFAPYFFIGYYTTEGIVEKLRSIKAYIRYPLGIMFALASSAIWYLQRDVYTKKLFFGKFNFKKMGFSESQGMILRFETYIIGVLMIIALILIMPRCKTVFSYIGKNSLQIFLFHMLLVIVFFDTEILNPVINSNLDYAIALLCALGVTLILSIKIFSYPFKWIQKGVNKLYKKV